jgi:hypothetical protein
MRSHSLQSIRINHEDKNDKKKKDKRNKNKEPCNARVSRTTDQVQNPSPEKDINELHDEEQECAANARSHRTHGIHISVSHVLEAADNKHDNRNDKIEQSRTAKILQFAGERGHLYINVI